MFWFIYTILDLNDKVIISPYYFLASYKHTQEALISELYVN